MLRAYKNILVTGGAGFIGINFIRYIFEKGAFAGRVINVDKLTYAGNLLSLADIDKKYGGKQYFFEKADICDFEAMSALVLKYEVDCIVHFAAESHVDRSIHGPGEFIQTNIIGTFNLLEVVREQWKGRDDVLFHHVSTDEVFGSLGDTGFFHETTAYDPRSPYSASKASSDHIVSAYKHTYGLKTTMSNCSNNYGPFQFPEKLIPLIIANILEGKSLPIYGDGKNIRDWLYVEDHASGIWKIITQGRIGESYNIGGDNERTNLEVVHALCEAVAHEKKKEKDHYKGLITFVKDRAGHDRRYAIDCSKIKTELGWTQSVDFAQGLEKTVRWYLDHPEWIAAVKSGDYQKWIDTNYKK